jgi:hypothetical protein
MKIYRAVVFLIFVGFMGGISSPDSRPAIWQWLVVMACFVSLFFTEVLPDLRAASRYEKECRKNGEEWRLNSRF